MIDSISQWNPGLDNDEATLITSLATPFPGMEHADSATPVKPDFAIVARRKDAPGTWLIMGDAKDYERVRSRIDDGRLLQGFQGRRTAEIGCATSSSDLRAASTPQISSVMPPSAISAAPTT